MAYVRARISREPRQISWIGRMKRPLSDLIERMSPWLRDRGFRRSGFRFVSSRDEVVHLIDFQRSRERTTCDRVTLNLGVASRRLLELDPRLDPNSPSIETCHWRIRLGRLLDPPRDLWWDLCDNSSAEAVSAELIDLLERYGLPRLTSLPSDNALVREWATGVGVGITRVEREAFMHALAPNNPEVPGQNDTGAGS